MIEPPDDLKRIKGIGLATESRLKEAGITTFAKLCRLTPAGIARIVPGRLAARIARENWIGQARKLASKSPPTRRRREGRTGQGHQHYATFTVELLLNDDNSVQRTHIKHVQSGNEKNWSGWNKAQLADFFVQQGQLNLPLPEHGGGSTPLRKRGAAHRPNARPEPIPPPEPIRPITESVLPSAPSSPSEMILPVEPASAPEYHSESETSRSSPPAVSLPSFGPNTGLHGVFQIDELHATSLDSNISSSIVFAGQKFNVCFVMNLTQVTRQFGAPLGYAVTVWAKKLGERSRQEVVGRGQDTIVTLEDEVPCTVEAVIASVGTYRLWVETTLTQRGTELLPPARLLSVSISKLLQVC